MKKQAGFPIRNLKVKILRGVYIREINWAMLTVAEVMFLVCMRQGRTPVMTGAAQSVAYRKGGLHDRGLAWDYRSEHLERPKAAFAELSKTLARIDKSFRVAYHDVGYGLHFHIEYNVTV